MRIAVTGPSGLIGSALVEALRADGHGVRALVRREPRPTSPEPGSRADPGEGQGWVEQMRWDPASGKLDPGLLEGVDAVVHLAGAGVGDRRWTPTYQRLLLSSRTGPTALLAETLATMRDGPKILLSASAIGWYGNTGGRPVDESEPAGRGFLAELVTAWEAATGAAEKAGLRVCHLRSGIVLSTRGGALAKQLPLFRAGLGGRLGSGRQITSWISLLDEVAAIRFLLTAPQIAGPVNLVAPNPVSNAVFTKELGTALHRPTVLPVPPFALRLVLGGFADDGVLVGQRVVPRVLADANFPFTHTQVGSAFRDLLAAGF